MISVFILAVLLIYFWYFYYSNSKPVPAPKKSRPFPSSPLDLKFKRIKSDEFELHQNGVSVWRHQIPIYYVSKDVDIQEMDECHHIIQDHQMIPAKGLGLYNFVKKHPKFQNLVNHSKIKDYGFVFRHGTPFYFTCKNRRIMSLTLCPSGHIFFNGACKKINSCTNQPDKTRFPHPDPYQWILCLGGEEHVHSCPAGTLFYGGKCTSEKEGLCAFQKDVDFFKLDDMTLFGCQNHTPVYKKCPAGTRLFDTLNCESSLCFGQVDGTKIPLQEINRKPFKFIPGYRICQGGKITETKECSPIWDPMLAEEENLTTLPMVFDIPSNQCTIPSLCRNVFPIESDVYVQEHQFTREIQNWHFSKFYDDGWGYRCDDKMKKVNGAVPVGKRINNHFKMVDACPEGSSAKLPINGYSRAFYDCVTKSYQVCSNAHFFNGANCRLHPERDNRIIFKYATNHISLPLFEFNNLDSEGWIKPFQKQLVQDLHCRSGYEYVKTYHLCSNKLCLPYLFLSMIPDFSLFVYPEGATRAKCKFDSNERYLKAIKTDVNYTFWDQKIHHDEEKLMEQEKLDEVCQFSPFMHIKTGNYFWDRTIFATCHKEQPFVFCPSTHTRQIIEIQGDKKTFACAPPTSFNLRHKAISQHTLYPTNMFQRVLRINNRLTSVKLNKGSNFVEVPPDGLVIPENSTLNIFSLEDVNLEYKFKITHPPNVVFNYKNNHREARVADDPVQFFNLRTEEFEYGKFEVPTYEVNSYVDKIELTHDP